MFYGASSFDKDISTWDVSAATARFAMSLMFDGASSLSDCNKALIHASFDAQTSAWPYAWGSLACPPPASIGPIVEGTAVAVAAAVALLLCLILRRRMKARVHASTRDCVQLTPAPVTELRV